MPADLKALEREQRALQERLGALEERRTGHDHQGPDPCTHCLVRDIQAALAKFPQNALSDVNERHLHRRLRDLEVRSLNFKDIDTLTIASGLITPTQTFHRVDTESAAATDNLAGIVGGAEGDVLILTGFAFVRTVTLLYNDQGEASLGERILLPNRQNMAMRADNTTLMLVFEQNFWVVVSAGPFNRYDRTTSPTVDNDITEAYSIGSTWIDTTNDKAYICVDNTEGAAVWTLSGAIAFDDATSDPLIDADSTSDGTEESPARKDHVHPKHHAKYTNANAVTAIEAEDPLDLAGVLNLAKNLNLTKGTSANIDSNDEIVVPAVAWLYRNAGCFNADPQRLYVSGHSAGGHLTAMILATDWPSFAGIPDGAVKGGCAISGVFDLEPVRLTFLNEDLGLDAESAARNSPAHHLPSRGAPLIVAVGGDESAEFLRQSRDFAAAWSAKGHACELLEIAGEHHFEIVEALADAEAPLSRALLRQMGVGAE